MQSQKIELADIIRLFGKEFIQAYNPNPFQLRTLSALLQCRTAMLGGHKQKCDCCGKERISYNSCRNRHCPKCQGSRQSLWVEDCMSRLFNVKHYHIVFTFPDELNSICLLDSKWFYDHLFSCVWSTLQTLGYCKYGVQGGAICLLHTWGQNLSLHPHVHCIVPSVGLSFAGKIKSIGKNGKYLYPVKLLSIDFRKQFMQGVKKCLSKNSLLPAYQNIIDSAWNKPWVVYCKPSFDKPRHVIKYLAQYTHRVAISNNRILKIEGNLVTFLMKDYRQNARQKPIRLNGIEFLRRFLQHILPHRFVRIRYYGIYSSKYKAMVKDNAGKIEIKIKEPVRDKLLRLTGFDIHQCPFCKKGRMINIKEIPKIRSPGLIHINYLIH